MKLQAAPLQLVLSLSLALASTLATAAPPTAKDIVLDRVQVAAVAAPVANRAAAPARNTAVVSDAMAVSVLVESADGTLTPRSTNANFRTGDRFRVKVVAARDGQIALYNTKPNGETSAEPVWRAEVRAGEELITARLRLDGQSGEDLLHVVLEPTAPSAPDGAWAWLRRVLGLDAKGVASKAAISKDIVLDVQHTPSTTYVVNARGEGLTTTLAIRHRR